MVYSQTDLQAKKVPELKTILTGLSLPTNGVKAELIARILESQSKTAGEGGAAVTDLPAAGNALGSIPSESELPPHTVNGTSDAPPPAETAPETSAGTANGDNDTTAAAADTSVVDETIAAPATDKASEAEKRANRLKRFGNQEDLAKLERAERFGATGADGIDDKSVSKLDSELSNKRIRKDDASSTRGGRGGLAGASASGRGGLKGARPGMERTKSGSGKPKSSNDGKPPAAAKPAVSAKAALDPAEEERRKKRADRFKV